MSPDTATLRLVISEALKSVWVIEIVKVSEDESQVKGLVPVPNSKEPLND